MSSTPSPNTARNIRANKIAKAKSTANSKRDREDDAAAQPATKQHTAEKKRVKCDCGKEVNAGGYAAHLTTDSHQTWVASQAVAPTLPTTSVPITTTATATLPPVSNNNDEELTILPNPILPKVQQTMDSFLMPRATTSQPLSTLVITADSPTEPGPYNFPTSPGKHSPTVLPQQLPPQPHPRTMLFSHSNALSTAASTAPSTAASTAPSTQGNTAPTTFVHAIPPAVTHTIVRAPAPNHPPRNRNVPTMSNYICRFCATVNQLYPEMLDTIQDIADTNGGNHTKADAQLRYIAETKGFAALANLMRDVRQAKVDYGL